MDPIRGYSAYGAWLGGMWYIIKDVICLPHGCDSFNRTLLAYGLLGGLAFATFKHPINFIHGFGAGAFTGMIAFETAQKPYPRGFELKMNFVDQNQR